MTAANQMFGPHFAGSNGEALETHAAIGEQREPSSVVQRESAHLSLDTASTAKFRLPVARSGGEDLCLSEISN